MTLKNKIQLVVCQVLCVKWSEVFSTKYMKATMYKIH